MFKQRSNTLFIAMLSMCLLFTVYGCQPPKERIIRQVDHVLIASSDADELFTLLADKFQLPVAWPIANYGRITSGGVAVGNVNLEIIRMPLLAEKTISAQFAGFAFEPEPLQDSLEKLDAREIRHGPAVPLVTVDSEGSIVSPWNTVTLPDYSSNTLIVFLCEYTHDVPAKRQQLLEQLQSRGGGPLSVKSVEKIVIGAIDVQNSRDNWQRILYPLSPSSQGVWKFESGPAIQVIPANKDGIIELVINVRSLAQARDFLESQGLLGINRQDELTLAGSYLQGLTIRLVEED